MDNASQPNQAQTNRPFQFRLSTLLICITVAAVLLGVLRLIGIDLLMALLFFSPLVAVLVARFIEFYTQWKKDRDDGW